MTPDERAALERSIGRLLAYLRFYVLGADGGGASSPVNGTVGADLASLHDHLLDTARAAGLEPGGRELGGGETVLRGWLEYRRDLE